MRARQMARAANWSPGTPPFSCSILTAPEPDTTYTTKTRRAALFPKLCCKPQPPCGQPGGFFWLVRTDKWAARRRDSAVD